MFAAAGAPPPPPPPPPKTSFHSLPAELLLNIIQYLQINDYAKLALAIYPILECHGLVPSLTPDIYHRVTRQQPPLPNSKLYGVGAQGEQGGEQLRVGQGGIPLPIELNDQIMDYLEPADRIAWLFSHREMFWRYFPALSKGTRKRLWNATQKSKTR